MYTLRAIRKRRAFTLIETIIVVSIVAIVVALLCSSIMKIRESAALIVTSNRYRQLGVGFHSYLSQHSDRIPGYYRLGHGVTETPPPGWRCPIESIMPHIDDRSSIRINGILYPRSVVNPYDPSLFAIDLVAWNFTDVQTYVNDYTTSVVNRLLFDRNRMLTQFARDGTAYTIAMTECMMYCGPQNQTWFANFGIVTDYREVNGTLVSISYPSEKRIQSRRPTFSDSWYDNVTPNNPLRFQLHPFQIAPRPSECDPRIPQTPHQALTVLMADGNVRRFSRSCHQEIFWALVTPNGGEIFNVPD